MKEAYESELDKLRERIDSLDEKLIRSLAERVSISKEIADLKQKNNLPVLDKYREIKLLERLSEIASENELDEPFVKDIFSRIISFSKKVQQKRIKSDV